MKACSEVTESFLELFRQTKGTELRVKLDPSISKGMIVIVTVRIFKKQHINVVDVW